jgi:hypothetical protein
MPAGFGHATQIPIQVRDRVRRTAVGIDAKRIGVLRCQQARCLAKPFGDPAIGRPEVVD